MADEQLTIVRSEPLPELSIVRSEPLAGTQPIGISAEGRPVYSTTVTDAPRVPGMERLGGYAPPPPKAPEPTEDALSRFFSGVARKADPVAFAKGVYTAVRHPVDTAVAIAMAQDEERVKALEDYRQGEYMRSLRHTLAWLTPLVGPQFEQISERADTGDVAGAFGEATGMLGPQILTEGIAAAKPNIPIAPAIAKTNPKVAGALDYLESKGVPVPAAAYTDNAFVKNIQKSAESTPLGAIVAQRAQRASTEALRAEAANLIERATPEIPADVHYANFRAAESNPANLKTIQTGTKTVPTGVLDASGNPITRTVPVTEQVALPVNVSSLKAQIRPIYDDMTKWWEPAKRNVSQAYQAMKSILEGPDTVQASQAEKGLGGLKELAREGTGANAGVAKFVVPKLQKMIDDAVAQGGPDAVTALQQGRKAAAAEVAVDSLNKIFNKATAEGGFNREAGIWQDWQRARGDVARQLPASTVSDLDKFFLGAKKLAENPNPSGSTTVAVSTGTGGLMFVHPATGIPLVLGAGALAKMLRSPTGIRLLTQGMKVPLGNRAASTAIASQILKLASDDVRPATTAESASRSPRSGQLIPALAR